MFGFRKKPNAETLVKQFYPVVSDSTALEAFSSAFETSSADDLRVFISRFSYLKAVAVYHSVHRRNQELVEAVVGAFQLLASNFKDNDKLLPIKEFFVSTLELQLAQAQLRLEWKPTPTALPVARLTEMALDMRNENFFKMVKGQTDLSVVLLTVAKSVELEIHGEFTASPIVSDNAGDQFSCLLKDWERIESIVKSL